MFVTSEPAVISHQGNTPNDSPAAGRNAERSPSCPLPTTPTTTTTYAQADAWQQAIATKQAHDLAAFHSAVAMTRRAQEVAAEPEEVANGKDEPGRANSAC